MCDSSVRSSGLAGRDVVYWRGRPNPERRHKRALFRGFGSTPLDKGASRELLAKKIANKVVNKCPPPRKSSECVQKNSRV